MKEIVECYASAENEKECPNARRFKYFESYDGECYNAEVIICIKDGNCEYT